MIDDKLFVVGFIADVHFGAMKADDLYVQLSEYFLKKLKKYPLDMLVFGGDLFHNVITMNYSTSHIVLMFMENVLDICSKMGIKYVRIIQGTVSHDNNQLHNFHMFESRTDVNFRIVMNVAEETLEEGVKILYLPEEYMENPEVYYSDYFDHKKKYYDFIFGHGMVEEVSFVGKNQESENTMSKAPIFRTKKLLGICKGPVFFGHIHTHTIVKKHLFYPGSFSRWKFGEEEDKGWYISIYNILDSTYANKFIKNKLAPIYTTVEVELTEEYNKHPEKIVETLKDVPADHVKVKLHVGENDSTYAVQYLTSTFKNVGNVKFEIKSKDKEDEFNVEDEEDIKLLDEYAFISDKNLRIEEIIQKFIEHKHERTIPIDIIEKELEPLKEKLENLKE